MTNSFAYRVRISQVFIQELSTFIVRNFKSDIIGRAFNVSGTWTFPFSINNNFIVELNSFDSFHNSVKTCASPVLTKANVQQYFLNGQLRFYFLCEKDLIGVENILTVSIMHFNIGVGAGKFWGVRRIFAQFP